MMRIMKAKEEEEEEEVKEMRAMRKQKPFKKQMMSCFRGVKRERERESVLHRRKEKGSEKKGTNLVHGCIAFGTPAHMQLIGKVRQA